MQRPQARLAALAAVGAGLAGLVWAGLALHPPGADSLGSVARADAFVLLLALAAVAYLTAVALVLLGAPTGRAALWLVLAVAVAIRLPPLAAPPFLSSDLYRYIWDGRVQAAGINPYRFVPADPALAALRDRAIYPHVNRRDYAHTIYPPMAQFVFAAVARIGQTPFAMKAAMLGFEAVAMGCVLLLLAQAGLPPTRLLIYAWNPLVAWCFAGNGHVDAIAIGCIGLALLACARRRPGWAGAALGAAALVKFLPVVIAPALWRRWDWRLPAAFAITVALFYLPYLGTGWHVLGFLPGYGGEEGIEDGHGIWLLAGIREVVPLPALAAPAYLVVAAAALAVLGLRVAARSHSVQTGPELVRTASAAGLLAAATMVAISPHYPWYFVWLALPACLAPARSIIWLSVAPLILYLDPLHERFVWPSLVYLPALVLAALDLRRHGPGFVPTAAGAAERSR